MDPKIQKIKLLKIWEILHRKTDEEHRITTMQIQEELDKMGIKAERHTIYTDINVMLQWGYEIQKHRHNRDMYYWVEKREFDLPELKLIMDAVETSKFIPQEKTDELLNKIADLGGSGRGDLLKRNSRHFNTVKHSNSDIYENIDVSERAIDHAKKVSFRYFDLNEYRERVYRHDNKIYVEEPLAMICNDGNYYLLCYHAEENYYDHVKVFRLDRMTDVTYVDEDISENASICLRAIPDYPKQVFKMYGGETKEVTLEFDAGMIGVIYNKFGEDTNIERIELPVDEKSRIEEITDEAQNHNDEETSQINIFENETVEDTTFKPVIIYRATVTVQLSPTFWGWLSQFPKGMRLIGPDDVRDKYKTWLQNILACM